MSSRTVSLIRSLAVATGLFALLFSPPSALLSQATGKSPADDQSSLRLKVHSDLVLVPVVVRDAAGRSISGLKKADFKLFDQGKEQPIAQFEEESTLDSTSTPATLAQSQAAPSPTVLPGRFLGLFFDDANTSAADLVQARDAADRQFGAGLQPGDHVAIFTTSLMLTDFTTDPRQIHEALFKLHVNPHNLRLGYQCPDLSDYQAQQILRGSTGDSEAWFAALAEARRCDPTDFPSLGSLSALKSAVRMLARKIEDDTEFETSSTVHALQYALNYVAKMPGQRVLILVSPGFLSESAQWQVDKVLDTALGSQVVVSSLDPKGLGVRLREFDAAHYGQPAGQEIVATHTVDSDREAAVSAVLKDFAQGTGGEFFHNSNDLAAGFNTLLAPAARYILAFVPLRTKRGQGFHSLRVSLAEPHPGYSIRTRSGYILGPDEISAPGKKQIDSTSAVEAPLKPASSIEVQVIEEIREALNSKNDIAQLSVELAAYPVAGQGETHNLSVAIHLDLHPLHFHKDAGHNVNSLTFVVAVFDLNDKVVVVKQRHAALNMPDERLPALVKKGMDAEITFDLKPGSYRLRAVVTDSEEHKLTALSRSVSVP